jgi:hypothetical protein
MPSSCDLHLSCFVCDRVLPWGTGNQSSRDAREHGREQHREASKEQHKQRAGIWLDFFIPRTFLQGASTFALFCSFNDFLLYMKYILRSRHVLIASWLLMRDSHQRLLRLYNS